MRRQYGFNLVELVIFIVVVAVAASAIALQYVQSASHSHEPLLRQRTLAVAGAYLDELLNKRWNESTPLGGGCVNTGSGSCPSGPAPTAIGPEAGESRATYDDVDDYNAIVNESPPRNAQGAVMSGYDGNWNVNVSVSQPGAAWNGIPAADVRQIEVQVDSPAGESITLTVIRVNL